jgi:hypothetical protein
LIVGACPGPWDLRFLLYDDEVAACTPALPPGFIGECHLTPPSRPLFLWPGLNLLRLDCHPPTASVSVEVTLVP